MKPTLEQLFADTLSARIAAGDTPDLAQSAAIAAVHRAGMLDAAVLVAGQCQELTTVNSLGLDDYGLGRKDAFDDIESAIRRAAGGGGC